MQEKPVFSTQNSDEKVLKVINRHPFVLFKDMFISIILFIFSLTLMIMFFYIYYVVLLGFLVLVFSVIWGFYVYFTWEKDKYIITDQRIVDIDQQTLFVKQQRETTIDKIQDVTSTINGIWGTLFQYGDVIIQTAGEQPLTLEEISRPEKLQKFIYDLVRQSNSTEEEEDSGDAELMQKMTDMIRKAIKEE